MKKLKHLLLLSIILTHFSCQYDENDDVLENQIEIPELAYPDTIGELITLNSNSKSSIRLKKIQEEYILSGDIILTEEQVASLSVNNSLSKRTGLADLATRWTNCTVFYNISPLLPNQARVTNAIAHWEANYPINFVLRTNQPNYIEFVPSTGCSSFLGMIGGRQEIRLAAGCSTGNTIHEIGHALGFLHEQQRSDRDNSIIINFQNIIPGRENNFRTYNEIGINGFEIGQFDFGSIMLYSSDAFSSNGLPTITRLDGSTFIGQRNGLSNGDLEMIDEMYNCYNAEITGPSPICNNTAITYNLSDASGTVNWITSPNLQVISSSNTGITVQSTNSFVSGEAFVEAQFSGQTLRKNLWIGRPRVPTNITFYSSSPCLNQNVIALVQDNHPNYAGVHYEWRGGGHNYVDQNPNGTEVHFTTFPSFPYTTNVFVKATNACGSSIEYSEVISVQDCGGGGGPAPLPQ